MSQNQIWIENERLIIHGVKEQDIDSLNAMRNDEKVYRYEPTFLLERQGTPEEALALIQKLDLYKDRQCILGVYEKTDPEVMIGLAEFYDYKPSGKVISIGDRLRSEYWGKGLSTCLIGALVDFIKEKTEVELITAHVLPDNKASAKCALKNGFEYLLTKEEDWGYNQMIISDVYTLDC